MVMELEEATIVWEEELLADLLNLLDQLFLRLHQHINQQQRLDSAATIPTWVHQFWKSNVPSKVTTRSIANMYRTKQKGCTHMLLINLVCSVTVQLKIATTSS